MKLHLIHLHLLHKRGKLHLPIMYCHCYMPQIVDPEFLWEPTTQVPVKICEHSSIRTIFVSSLILTFIVSLELELGNLELNHV